MPNKYFSIALFGALGAGSRYALTFFVDNTDFPLATLVANLLGCLLLGILVGYIEEIEPQRTNLIIGLKGGFLGSFTTFSSFCFEGLHLSAGQNYLTAFTYMAVSLVFGMFLAGLGLYYGEKIGHKKGGEAPC